MTTRPSNAHVRPSSPSARTTVRLSYEQMLADPASASRVLRERFVVLALAEMRESWDRWRDASERRTPANRLRVLAADFHDKQRHAQKAIGTLRVLDAILDDPDLYAGITVDQMRAAREQLYPNLSELEYR